ncbi:MAG: SDR family NAD(P)-dependent oxidoreductase [Pseudomonadota bacterium]
MADDWKVAWVTGASSGIGEALARKLANAGVKVAVSARSAESLKSLEDSVGSITAFPLDVTDAEGCTRTISDIEAKLGPIDLAVFCAGTWDIIDIDDLAVGPIEKGMRVNYVGTVNCMVPLARLMMERRSGHLAPVASVAGYRGLPRASAYGPTKAALNSLCQSLKPALDGFNVTTTIINPGFVDTPMTAKNDFPMPYLMQPDEAADKIFEGLKSKRYEVAFPWQLVTQLKFLSILPSSLYFYLMKKFVSKG